jgi:hypothetical protein
MTKHTTHLDEKIPQRVLGMCVPIKTLKQLGIEGVINKTVMDELLNM